MQGGASAEIEREQFRESDRHWGDNCMNAHAAMLRYPRAPFAFRRAPLRSTPSRRRQALGLGAPQYRGTVPGRADMEPAWLAWSASLSASLKSFASSLAVVTKGWKAGTAAIARVPIDARMAGRLSLGALTGAGITLAIINNGRSEIDASEFLDRNETVVYRQASMHQASLQRSSVEDEGSRRPTTPRRAPRRCIRAPFKSSSSSTRTQQIPRGLRLRPDRKRRQG